MKNIKLELLKSMLPFSASKELLIVFITYALRGSDTTDPLTETFFNILPVCGTLTAL